MFHRLSFRYVCVVQDVLLDNEYEVMGLKCVNADKQMFQTKENDKSFINRKNIIAVLPDPSLIQEGERLRYKFDFPVDVKEV